MATLDLCWNLNLPSHSDRTTMACLCISCAEGLPCSSTHSAVTRHPAASLSTSTPARPGSHRSMSTAPVRPNSLLLSCPRLLAPTLLCQILCALAVGDLKPNEGHMNHRGPRPVPPFAFSSDDHLASIHFQKIRGFFWQMRRAHAACSLPLGAVTAASSCKVSRLGDRRT